MILNPKKYKDFNELFAQYLGCTKDENDNWVFPDGAKMTKTMHFHDRWDWLMMIVEKISNNLTICLKGKTVLIEFTRGEGLISQEEKTLLLNTYNVCYQYIKNQLNETGN